MFMRTGWFGAAALAAALVVAGGCKSGETTETAPPPSEQAPGGAPVEGQEQPATTEGEPPAPSGAQAQQPGGAPVEGQPGGQPAAPGGETTQPAGAAQAPGADQGMIQVSLAMAGGQTSATVAAPGMGAGEAIAVKEGEVPAALVDMLKKERETLMASGQKPHVVITGPLDVPFDTVVIPVVRASIRAGFQRNEVEYKPEVK